LLAVTAPVGWCQLVLLPDQKTLVATDAANSRLLLLDVSGPPSRGAEPATLPSRYGRIPSLAVSPDGKWLASGGHKEIGIQIWDLSTRRLVRLLSPGDGHVEPRFDVAFSPDNRWLVSATHSGDKKAYYFWRVGTWEREKVIPTLDGMGSFPVVFGAEGTLLALGVSRDKVLLADPATGRTVAHLSTQDPLEVAPLDFSPDGGHLAVATNQGTVLLWDLRRVRQELAKTGVDWDRPPYPAPGEKASGIVRVVVDQGVLADNTAQQALAVRRHLGLVVALQTIALAAAPRNAEACYQRAQANVLLERWPEALADCNVYLALRADYAPAYYLRGQVLEHLGRNREALADYLAAMQREPHRVPSLAELQQVLAGGPRPALEYNNTAWSDVGVGGERRSSALVLLLAEKAVLLDPAGWYCRNTLGVAQYRFGLWRQAVTTLTGALALSHGQHDGFDLYFLAMSYARLGDAVKARDCFDRAAAWWRAHPELRPEQQAELKAFRAEAEALLRK
jgi:tetratricopeptide (TPR) repeat protein